MFRVTPSATPEHNLGWLDSSSMPHVLRRFLRPSLTEAPSLHRSYPASAGGFALLDIQGMPTIPIDAKGDKEERAGAVCWVVNKGLVQLPQAAPWLEVFVDELENFPLVNFKDQVDAFVHGLAWELRKRIDFNMEHLSRVVPRLGSGGGGVPAFNNGIVDAPQELLEFERDNQLWNDFFRDEP